MSNSELISYTAISPNKTSPRNHKIDTIAIHCMAGHLSLESCGNLFSRSSTQASSNYGIDDNGKIAMYVEEKDRSWCTSSRNVDNRAITIEVASDSSGDCKVTDAALQATIKLCVDICKRNNIEKLVWSNNRDDRVNHLNGCNMEVHRDYAYKSCPGDYLYNRMGDIAEKVNTQLNQSSSLQGWQEDENGYWFAYGDGSYPKNTWKTIDDKDYYFKANGYMASNEYVKSANYDTNKLLYFVGKDGAWNKQSYMWKSNNKGWWIENIKTGAFPKKAWRVIDGKKYYFDKNGYIVTGKVKIGVRTYKFGADGALIS